MSVASRIFTIMSLTACFIVGCKSSATAPTSDDVLFGYNVTSDCFPISNVTFTLDGSTTGPFNTGDPIARVKVQKGAHTLSAQSSDGAYWKPRTIAVVRDTDVYLSCDSTMPEGAHWTILEIGAASLCDNTLPINVTVDGMFQGSIAMNGQTVRITVRPGSHAYSASNSFAQYVKSGSIDCSPGVWSHVMLQCP